MESQGQEVRCFLLRYCGNPWQHVVEADNQRFNLLQGAKEPATLNGGIGGAVEHYGSGEGRCFIGSAVNREVASQLVRVSSGISTVFLSQVARKSRVNS